MVTYIIAMKKYFLKNVYNFSYFGILLYFFKIVSKAFIRLQLLLCMKKTLNNKYIVMHSRRTHEILINLRGAPSVSKILKITFQGASQF